MMTKPIPDADVIMTVRGRIPASRFGKALAHEHVLCDFIGAGKTGPHRYDADAVVERMLPFLQQLRKQCFTGFVDCTPAYIGRDPEILRRLAELTDLHILTNTGYYGASGDKFLPPHAFSETAEELAARRVRESERGIGQTGIKAGFIKIGVDPGPLSQIGRKLVQAAAKTHLQTGLTIACHTGEAEAALAVLETIRRNGVNASALIIVHADSISDQKVHIQLAKAGAWLGYDGLSSKTIEKHVLLIRAMVTAGLTRRLLISHDAGWYRVGEPQGGKAKIRPYTAIADQLIPALKTAGLDETLFRELLLENPARAFTVRIRPIVDGSGQAGYSAANEAWRRS